MKQLLLVPVLLGALALPAMANETATATTPNKVTITPATGATGSSAAATVTTAPEAALKQSKVKGGHGCGGSKTTALIN